MFVDLESGDIDWRRAYQLCIGFINPRPIALVSTVSADGARNVAPFSFYNMVCANPPTVIFCPGLNRAGEPKDSLVNVEATGEFVVATVTSELGDKMVRTAASLPRGESEYEFAGLTPAPARFVRPSLVAESPANIECRLDRIVRLGEGAGSSAVVFGRIVAIHLDDAVLDSEALVDPRKLHTVGRLGGQWYADVSSPYELRIPKV
ncbi:MAG: flavin reductase family protein [Planctomycetota bacterium]|nr:MAG: flavin reductase family protein [Planctomycetota bacterium]